MATAKQIINSIKPNISKVPTGKTQLGSAGYDNVRDDIEKVKKIREGSVEKTPTVDNDIANKKYVDDEIDTDILTHKGDANAHHNESHNIASHSDTSATGTELNTLTDNSIANTLHRHSELVASDGSPDPALSVDATGRVGVGGTPDQLLTVLGGWIKIKSTNYPQYVMLSNLASSQEWSFFGADNGFFIRNRTNSTNPFGIMNDAPSNSFRIIASGNTGINTQTPDTKLQVVGDFKSGEDTTNYFSLASNGTARPRGTATYQSNDGTAGLTQTTANVNTFDIVIKDGLITSFTKNS